MIQITVYKWFYGNSEGNVRPGREGSSPHSEHFPARAASTHAERAALGTSVVRLRHHGIGRGLQRQRLEPSDSADGIIVIDDVEIGPRSAAPDRVQLQMIVVNRRGGNPQPTEHAW